MTELKPCPFCGGKATLVNNQSGTVYVECTKCFAMGERMYDWWGETTEQAIEAWNRRTE